MYLEHSLLQLTLQEIPWENIWHPECIIRKHIHVNILKRDVSTSVQVYTDDGKNKLTAEFVWKVKTNAASLLHCITSTLS